jgi:hypothetical protein
MSKRNMVFLSGLAAILAAALMVGCGSNGGSTSSPLTSTATGSVVTFGTDAPICDVESFSATIYSANLVQAGGQTAALVTDAAPATVDFARLTDSTNILSTASSVPAGTYTQLQMTLRSSRIGFAAAHDRAPSLPETAERAGELRYFAGGGIRR